MIKKKLLSPILFLVICSITSAAQSWQWAFTTGSTPRSQATVIKQDHNKDFYFATFTDSVTTRMSTQMEKRDANQQVLWDKQIVGNATITDLEINSSDHVFVVGYFMGTVSIDGNQLTSFSPSDNNGFIFESDETGTIQWVHELNPINGDFRPGDLFLSGDGSMYLTSSVTGAYGFCAFHKLNSQGFIVKNEFNNNFENRTFSHVLADDAGNVYLSGTCGNGATFDTINANPGFSYQNMLVKYDSSFKAQWLVSYNYITFDDNNGLTTDGQNLFWVFNDYTSNADTVRILTCDLNGQVLRTVNGPLGNAFFPAINFAMDESGNSVLVLNVFVRLFLYRYDDSFNLTWQDTILTYTSGFPFHSGLACYDSSFYLTNYFLRDTLMIGNHQLFNQNSAANFSSDIFVAKWSNEQPAAINNMEKQQSAVFVFPNPVHNELRFENLNLYGGELIAITDGVGKIVYVAPLKSSTLEIKLLNLQQGTYFYQVINKSHDVYSHGKFIVM